MLALVAEVIRRRFGVHCTLPGVDLLLHRIGWSVQVPARRAAERDEAKIAKWKDERWPAMKGTAADPGAWVCFEEEAGQGLRPSRGRPPGRKGFTETDYARLLDAAHQQLDGPVVVIRDNLNTRASTAMKRLVSARSWLTVCQLPPCTPELNPPSRRCGPTRSDPWRTCPNGVSTS
ncbi:hypothetical protein GCM10010349_79390 [Streptomyces flavofungini]|nr:winged helix-turn-helix domain-containing protein [Streptomyces flavofungini]GHC91075.1 hypothetical protein GCM10010349_79390 [Streptomyces flavofungini]